MKTEEYILSGILEAYALGELSQLERSDVEKNISLHPELKAELLRIEIVQEKLLMEEAIKPRPEIKVTLLNTIISEKKIKPSQVIEINHTIVWKYSLAASFALMVAASIMAYHYRSKWKESESSLNELIAQNQRLASEYSVVNERLEKIELDIHVINNPAFTRTILNGTENSPGSMAYVYWNKNTEEVYLSLQNMKELAQKNQYQLWAIVDGKPVDAGVFDSNFVGLLRMKNITGATAFAVTIEPRGGKVSPTLETMQVIGNTIKG